MGIKSNPICRGCHFKEEIAAQILCECKELVRFDFASGGTIQNSIQRIQYRITNFFLSICKFQFPLPSELAHSYSECSGLQIRPFACRSHAPSSLAVTKCNYRDKHWLFQSIEMRVYSLVATVETVDLKFLERQMSISTKCSSVLKSFSVLSLIIKVNGVLHWCCISLK